MGVGLIHYQSPVEDSRRWLGFRLRPGDIIISTRRKTGTTWMQMICALLILQDPELPDSLWNLSPWLDNIGEPHELVYDKLAQQRHRRFIKTHTPLDGLPLDPGVTYIVTARNPLDAFVSLCRHNEVIAPPDSNGPPPVPPPAGFGLPPGTPPPSAPPPGSPGPWPGGPPPGGFGPPPGGPPHMGPPPGGPPPGGPPPGGFGPPPGGPGPWPGGPPNPLKSPVSTKPPASPNSHETLHDALLAWITDAGDPRRDADSLAGFLAHMTDAWSRRNEPNVLLVHYDDLLADLAGQMHSIASRLGIDVPEQAWPALIEAATFGSMRDRAGSIIHAPPETTGDIASFFRRGTSGAGREVLSDEELAGYYARTARLAPPDMLKWLHRERVSE